VEAWNKRPIEDALRAELAQVREETALKIRENEDENLAVRMRQSDAWESREADLLDAIRRVREERNRYRTMVEGLGDGALKGLALLEDNEAKLDACTEELRLCRIDGAGDARVIGGLRQKLAHTAAAAEKQRRMAADLTEVIAVQSDALAKMIRTVVGNARELGLNWVATDLLQSLGALGLDE
jgi:hypothetical protein